MQVPYGKWLQLALLLGCVSMAAAQTTGKSTQKSPPWTEYCHGDGGFCFKYPASWSVLGEVFDGNGVVVAPPQKLEREYWDEVTVALVIPPPQSAADAVTIDQLIDRAVSGVRERGQSFETLERQSRRVDGKPAQLVKLHYVDKASGREWIEELVFVEGPDAEIYSVALKCAPSSMTKMEPVFSRMLGNWTLPEVESAPGASEGGEQPAQSSTAPPAPPQTATPPKP